MTTGRRITWSKIAKILTERHLEGIKCKICNTEIEGLATETNALKKLNIVYKHFKEKHPEIINQIKQELKS